MQQPGGQHHYADPAACEQLSRFRSISPPGGSTVHMNRGGPGCLSPAAYSSSPMTSPAGYYKSPGYSAQNAPNSNSSSRSPSPMQQRNQQRLVDASAAVKGVYGPILEEQQTLTETCSWSGSVNSGGGGFVGQPGRIVCSTPVSPCISPDPGPNHPHHNPHWLRNVFRVAASKALGKSKAHQPGQPQAPNPNHGHQQQQQQQQYQQQQQQQQFQQLQQQAGPGALNSWDMHQQHHQQQTQATWWKPKSKQCLTLAHRPITPEMTIRPRSVSPVQLRPRITSPVSTNVLPLAGSVYRTTQQYNSWAAQGGAAQGSSTSYPKPQYEQHQQQQQQVRQLSMQLPMPPQPFQQQQQQQQQMVFTRTTHGPFAQTETQQAVLGHQNNNATDPAAVAAVMDADAELGSAASGGTVDESSACPQVVNASNGQVLKVSSGEFQDIMTVMQALADARKSLAVRLNVSETDLHSQHDVVAAAAAKMAAAAAATATATAHTASSASSQQQQQQQQEDQRDPRQHPTAAAGDAPTALDVEASTEDAGYRVYSCTVKGLVPSEGLPEPAGPSSYPLADGQLLSNVSAADAAEAIWQQQQQQQQAQWAQVVAANSAAAAAAGEDCSLLDSTTRRPSQTLLNTSLTGEQHASAIDLAADTAAEYSMGALGSTGATCSAGNPGNASSGLTRQEAQSQQEPDTPHSLSSVLVHAPASCAGVLLTGSTPGASPLQSKNASALNTAEVRQMDTSLDETKGAVSQQGAAAAVLSQQGVEMTSALAAGRAQAQAAAHCAGGRCPGTGAHHSSSGSSLDSLLSSDVSERQLELHHTGWTDDDCLHLGELRAQFNVSADSEHLAPDPTPTVLKSSPVSKWDDITERAVPPKHDPEHMQMKHLYKKVAELESGLLKLLSGSLITPAAAASLIASLNKIAASGVVKPLSSGGGAADGTATDNKLVGTIQKAALAAAAASSNGGAPSFAVALGRLANSMGGKKSFSSSGSGSGRQKSFSGSSRSGGSSITGQIASRKTDSSQAESQASVDRSKLQLDLSKVASSGSEAPATDNEAEAPGTAETPTKSSKNSTLQEQQPAQQQQQQRGPSADHMQHTAGVAMAMEVLAKAEERLKELHMQEERLKALWASRGSSAALLGRRSVSRKSSGQPETIQEVEQEHEHRQNHKLSCANSARASRAASSAGKSAGLLVVQQQQQQRKPSMDMRESSLSRRVSFQDDYHRSVSYTEQESSDPGRSIGGKSCSTSQLMSPRGTEESCDKAAVERSFAGTESDAFSGCWSDDSADPSSRVRRLLSQQRRHRLQLKQQRSAGGTGCGYESADEPPVSSGGAYSESVDEEFEEPGRYLLSHLHAFGTHRSLTPDGGYASNASHHAALHSAPVTSGYSAASRRHLLLSLAAPERERSFDDVTAKAVARVRKNIAAGKPSRPFKARDVPAHVYESRYASIMNTREAAKALRAQATAAAAAKQSGSYARGLSSPPPTSSSAHRSRTLGASAGSRHSGSLAPSKSVRVPGAATAAQMLASSTHSSAYSSMRNGSGTFGSRASAGRADAAAAAKLPSSGRGARKQAAKATCSDHVRHASHSGALRGLDTVLEKQVLRSNPTALLPAALKRAYAPYKASVSPSSAAAAGVSAGNAAGRSWSPGRATATAGSSYSSDGHRRAGKPAVTATGTAAGAAGGYSTSMSGGTVAAASSSSSSSSSSAVRVRTRARHHNNSCRETDDGLQYLTNLFTLKRACQAATQPQAQKHRTARISQQVESTSGNSSNSSSRPDSKESYLGLLSTAMRPSSRNRDRSVKSGTRSDSRSDNQRRSPSPQRDSYCHSNSGRDRSPLVPAGQRWRSSRSRPASVDGYSSSGGAAEQLWPSGYSKHRSLSAERVRRSERSEVTRSVEGRSRLQSSTMQPRHSVDAGSYARHLNRRSVDTGGYASRLSVTDADRRSTVTGGSSGNSSSWKVHAAAAELERRIQHYRTGRASPP